MTDDTRRRFMSWAAGLALAAAGGSAWADTGQATIVQPRADETIHDNSGHVNVAVSIDGGRELAAGERLRLVLDGMPAGRDRRSLATGLDGVARGTHSLKALVVDRSGNVVASSDPVTFHMWQASRLFPNRRR